jgi:glutamine synthetase
MHINLSLSQKGLNIYRNMDDEHSNVAEKFIAGVLSKTLESTLFLNPIANSYERFGKFEAPAFVSWSHQNRSQLVRIPAAGGEKARMELRSPDPAINPYLAFALVMAAGLEGIENEMILPAAVDADLYIATEEITKGLAPMPTSLRQAIRLTKDSRFVRDVVGDDLLTKYLLAKEAEATAYDKTEDKNLFNKERYFEII